jgi:hypothetical protein
MIVPSNLDDTIPIVCNTEDHEIFGNITAAVARDLPWLQLSEPHDGVAVIVGGGPSMKPLLPMIAGHKAAGQAIFAVNGTIPSLASVDVTPDYFVLLDARSHNKGFVHPNKATKYLIASQCSQGVFDALDGHDVTLWHPAYPGIQDYIGDRLCALIGGGTTVGLQAMSIAFAMGYRHIHLYGFDSSYSKGGDGHAYEQTANAADPRESYWVGGKEYISTPWMARQAMEFQTAAQQLADEDAIIQVHGHGLLPAIAKAMSEPPAPMSEVQKYEAMWQTPLYREVAPGESFADHFIEIADPQLTDVIVDFGCGTGRGGKKIADLTRCEVQLVDFADNCRDEGNNLPFTVADLTKPIGVSGNIGYCTDVMEHIPPGDVPDVIQNIMDCVDSCYFKIALFDDSMGKLIGHPLHLSVFPSEWWQEKFSAYHIQYEHSDKGDACPYATFYVQNPK